MIRKLLSRQQHYDWGLRALKSVLRSAGDGLRASSENNSTDAEYSVVVRALTFNTISKLTTSDSNLFSGLVNDIFPMVQLNLQDAMHERLAKIIAKCCEDIGVILLEQQVNFFSFLYLFFLVSAIIKIFLFLKVKKVLEVYEQVKQRIGVVVVGPPQTGKSTVCAILKRVSNNFKKN